MSLLSDDEVAQILNWVTDPDDRKSCSEVCKQWLRVEALNRSSIRFFEPDLLLQVLPRFPNLVQFETTKFITDTDLAFLAQTCPKIEVINLNFRTPPALSYEFDPLQVLSDVGDEGLCALANGCPKLSKVSLRRRQNIGNFGLVSLVNLSHNLTYLDLGCCGLVSDQALEAIGSASSIIVLNLQRCYLVTDIGLGFLANGCCSKTMRRLNLSECDGITDFGVSLLQQLSCLEQLNLAECGPNITDSGALSIAAIQTLKNLNFSWLINVTDSTLVALAGNCMSLEMLDLTGCERVSGDGIRAFASHKCLEVLVLRRACFNVCWSDLEHLVLGCASLESMVLDRGLKFYMLPQVGERIRKFVRIVWY